MYSFSFSMSNSTCLGPFMVVFCGMKYTLTASQYANAPQITWFDGRFIVATYFLSKRLPIVRLMCMWRGTNCCMVHSSQNNTFFHSASPMAMTSGKVQSLFLHHWCQVWLSCRPVGLLSDVSNQTNDQQILIRLTVP